MSLPIGTALKDGFSRVANRAGAVLLIAYLVVNVVYLVAMNSTMKAYLAETAPEAASTLSPAVDLPVGAAAAALLMSFLLTTYLYVVAIRTFVADERHSIRSEHLTGGVTLALVNLLIGGLVYSIGVTIGWVLLFVPGIFLMVVLAFWPVYVAVEGNNFVTAMRRSWKLTEGDRFALFALGAVMVGIGFAVGTILGIGALVATLAGLNQGILNVVQIVVIAPVSLYSLGVLASAFDLLREESEEFGGESTTVDAPSTPA
ncbi:hypothetical protein OB920_05510 [Halobacteria archaeon HArc-gm2]|nr:hypothetical protein [Halobacteria archaeon HArc-gm2]